MLKISSQEMLVSGLYPRVYRIFAAAGLLASSDLPALDVIGSSPVFPAFVDAMADMDSVMLTPLLQDALPFYVHNAIKVEGFPVTDGLIALLARTDEQLSSNSQNPWYQLIDSSVTAGNAVDIEWVSVTSDTMTKAALAMARPQWETLASTFSDQLIAWLIDNRRTIECWQQYYTNKASEPV